VPIQWERDGPIGVAVIDRQDRRNALNAELCEELVACLGGDEDLRVIVIGGAGDKAFCAGADLSRRKADQFKNAGVDSFRPAFDRLLESIIAQPVPVIAAINGAALGAGMQLAVACDLRVVAEHARFAIPAGRLGVLLTVANVARLASVVGQATARDILLTGRVLDVDAAERVGLVQRRAVDALTTARELAGDLAELAPLSAAGHKRALNLVTDERHITPEARVEGARLEAAAFASADLQEGLAAFEEKRQPRFEGR